jgi:hypothetical protein
MIAGPLQFGACAALTTICARAQSSASASGRSDTAIRALPFTTQPTPSHFIPDTPTASAMSRGSPSRLPSHSATAISAATAANDIWNPRSAISCGRASSKTPAASASERMDKAGRSSRIAIITIASMTKARIADGEAPLITR